MRKYLYIRDVADEADDDDISASVAIPVDAITGVVPTAITTLDLYFKNDGAVATQKISLTCTRGKLQEVCASIAATANAYPHNPGLTVLADAVVTTNGASSIQGNDISVTSTFPADVSAVSITQG
tara:strand:+ start:128 stop:502 length:375 start_codon:yes stop_codon:yes gene_type:complete